MEFSSAKINSVRLWKKKAQNFSNLKMLTIQYLKQEGSQLEHHVARA